MAKEKKVQEKGFFYSVFSVTIKESHDPFNEAIIEKLGHDFQYVIFLYGFYLTSRVDKLQESEEERLLLAGLGKQTLCKVFNRLFGDYGHDEAVVALDASGNREMNKAEIGR